MKQDFIKIAHLSDLHFTNVDKNRSCYKTLKDDLPNQKPDLIIVTGDIADNRGIEDLEVSLNEASVLFHK